MTMDMGTDINMDMDIDMDLDMDACIRVRADVYTCVRAYVCPSACL